MKAVSEACVLRPNAVAFSSSSSESDPALIWYSGLDIDILGGDDICSFEDVMILSSSLSLSSYSS